MSDSATPAAGNSNNAAQKEAANAANDAEGAAPTKTGNRRPANTAFKQQRLRAWQPILTPWTVLPVFFLLGVTMIPLGAWFYSVANAVVEVQFDYTECARSAPFTMRPVSDDRGPVLKQWSFNGGVCTVLFELAQEVPAPVFLYYRLTNFYQNHRRYVKSVSAAQLADSGAASSTDCDPLYQPSSNSPFVYYPCGLIANSIFNDTIGEPDAAWTNFRIQQPGGGNTYSFTSKGIAWPSDASKYATPTVVSNSTIVPPKDWGSYRGKQLLGNGSVPWSQQPIMFDPSQDEQFQVWMRTAGLPTFRKLYGQNLREPLPAGQYEMKIQDNFPVIPYGGTKSIVIGTTSWLGGRNTFLGVAYLVVGSVCMALGLAFLLKQIYSPRKLGDHTYLSWNQVTHQQQQAVTGGSGGRGSESPQ